jgi:hypothetical protein
MFVREVPVPRANSWSIRLLSRGVKNQIICTGFDFGRATAFQRQTSCRSLEFMSFPEVGCNAHTELCKGVLS